MKIFQFAADIIKLTDLVEIENKSQKLAAAVSRVGNYPLFLFFDWVGWWVFGYLWVGRWVSTHPLPRVFG